MFDDDVAELGFVMNASELWSHQPATMIGLFDLAREAKTRGDLTLRQLGILVNATASSLGDSYCSLAWGMKLSNMADPETAVGVIRGDDGSLDDDEAAMARWARKVVRDPNGTTRADVDELRRAGFSDEAIFAITTFVALRLAFSTVNDALGARPDPELRAIVPPEVQDAVTFGRPFSDQHD